MRMVRTIAGDTANTLLYRELSRSDDVAEEAFWLLNPTLAEYGSALPAGLRVTLPELEAAQASTTKISAWE